jgi:RNA polymerase sigma-70 factor (ECF subfamily)
LAAAVETLPDLYRTLIHLHYWRGLTIAEMASVLESRPGTIKSYLHRARARLEEQLGDLS